MEDKTEDIMLQKTDRIELVNHGLNPDLTHQNYGDFSPKRVLEHLQNGGNAVVFSGIMVKIECWDVGGDYSLCSHPFQYIMHLDKEVDEEAKYLEITPFNLAFAQGVGRYSLSLEGRHLSGDENNILLCGDHELKDKERGTIEISFCYNGKDGPKIALPSYLPKSEIHKLLLEEIARQYDLTFEEYSEKCLPERETTVYNQGFTAKNGVGFTLSVERRKGSSAFIPKRIKLKIDSNEGLIRRIKNHSSINFFMPEGEFDEFLLTDTFYQTQTLDLVLQEILKN